MKRVILAQILGMVIFGAGAQAVTRYVALEGLHQWPYTNWATAATNIASAVQASGPGDTVLVTNGIYYLLEAIVVSNGIAVRSVNGAAHTIVDGLHTTSCFRIEHTNTIVSGFTIRNGRTAGDGGGVWCGHGAILEHCVIRDNTITPGGGGDGGGVLCLNARVRDCVIVNNYAADDGGGIQLENDGVAERCWIADNTAADKGGGAVCRRGGTLRNCVLVGNLALCDVGDPVGVGLSGGAVYGRDGAINIVNCTIVSNTAPGWVGGVSIFGGTVNIRNTILHGNPGGNYGANQPISFGFTCTTPLPFGTGNITNAPVFVDAQAGNFRLQAGSPGIDMGNLDAMPDGPDIDGVPRPLDGNADGVAMVDMGAYEFANPLSDTDGDGMSDAAEALAGTDPTDPSSRLAMLDVQATHGTVVIQWMGGAGTPHILERTTVLGADASDWKPLVTNAAPAATLFEYIDEAGDAEAAFYRITVGP